MNEEQAKKKLIKEMGWVWWHHINTFFPGDREREVRRTIAEAEKAAARKAFKKLKPYVPLPPWREGR